MAAGDREGAGRMIGVLVHDVKRGRSGNPLILGAELPDRPHRQGARRWIEIECDDGELADVEARCARAIELADALWLIQLPVTIRDGDTFASAVDFGEALVRLEAHIATPPSLPPPIPATEPQPQLALGLPEPDRATC